MTKPANRLLELDVLRAVACLLIVCGHTAEEIAKLPLAHSSTKIAHDIIWQNGIGNTAVVIFFAISGFGICSSMRGPRLKGSLDFIIRRFFRLYPVFWLSMVVAILFYWIPHNKPFDFTQIVANATMIPEVFGEGSLIIVYWTLETELAFYFLCLMLFLVRGHNNPYMISGMMLLLFGLFCFYLFNRDMAPRYAPWFGMPYHICIAFWGTLYRYCLDNKNPISFIFFSLKPWTLFFILTGIILLPAIYIFGGYFIASKPDYMKLRLSVPIIAGVVGFYVFTRWLPIRSQKLAELGNYTYAIYLLHHVTITYSVHLLADRYPELFSLPVYVYFIVVFAFNTFLGYFIYNYIEKFMMDYSKRLVKKL